MNFLSFSLFNQSPAVSSRALDGHIMVWYGMVNVNLYSAFSRSLYYAESSSNVFRRFGRKASTIDIEISPIPSLIFIGGGVKKSDIWRRFHHHSTSSRPRLKMK